MKTFCKSLIGGTVIAFALACTPAADAQNMQTGYFDDNYMYRFQSNPAFANENGFVSMPGLGNLNVGVDGTIGVKHILYNINGKTTTLLNPGVSAAEVLDGLKNKSRLGVSLRETVIAVGFKGIGGYNTVSVGARADLNIGLPKDIFRLAKEGVSNSVYDLSGLSARAAGWAEVSLGHSHAIGKKLRVGANFKVLVGVGSAVTKIDRAELQLHDNVWNGIVNARLNTSVKGLTYKQGYNDKTNREYVNGFDFDDFSPVNGFGVAFDLGAVYELTKDWQLSASLLDLGFISWGNNMEATTGGEQQVSTDEFTFNVDNNDSFDKFKDNLSKLYQLEDKGDQGSRISGIGATFNIGAQYTLPVYRRLKFGLLNTTRINGNFSWTDFRLSANVEPVHWFSATASFGMGTFGPALGWMVNFKTKGINFFVATDTTPFKLAKQGVPLNSNANVNLGLNFPF